MQQSIEASISIFNLILKRFIYGFFEHKSLVLHKSLLLMR